MLTKNIIKATMEQIISILVIYLFEYDEVDIWKCY